MMISHWNEGKKMISHWFKWWLAIDWMTKKDFFDKKMISHWLNGWNDVSEMGVGRQFVNGTWFYWSGRRSWTCWPAESDIGIPDFKLFISFHLAVWRKMISQIEIVIWLIYFHLAKNDLPNGNFHLANYFHLAKNDKPNGNFHLANHFSPNCQTSSN